MKLKIFPRFFELIPVHTMLPSFRKTTSVSYKYQFEEWEYDIQGDQSDWNKLTGLKSKFFKPLDEAYMVVWRWYEGELQLAFYSNLDGEFTLPNEEDIITLPTPDTPFEVRFHVERGGVFASINVYNNASPGLTLLFKSTWIASGTPKVYTWAYKDKPKWEVSFWFGGNRTPDKLIVCNRWKL